MRYILWTAAALLVLSWLVPPVADARYRGGPTSAHLAPIWADNAYGYRTVDLARLALVDLAIVTLAATAACSRR